MMNFQARAAATLSLFLLLAMLKAMGIARAENDPGKAVAIEETLPAIGAYLARADVRAWIVDTSTERGFDRSRIAGLFARLQRRDDVLAKISSPAERTLTWREYRPIFLGDERITAGRAFLDEHRATFVRAEKQFGVPAEIIAAIIGVETFYGRIVGRDSVLESLVTLGFDYPPRATFFRSELAEFLTLAEKEGWNPLTIKGSYAGAMGLPQFISSSYRQFAIDFDDDERVDLFGNIDDVIGSVANYLARHGWQRGQSVAEPWQPAAGNLEAARALVRNGLSPVIAVETVRRLGFDGAGVADDAESERLSVMTFAGSTGEELWVGYKNFYAITRYNHSRLYALAVYQLAEKLGTGV